MNYSSNLEYIVGISYSGNSYKLNYFSKNIDDNYNSELKSPMAIQTEYAVKTGPAYKNRQKYLATYSANHSFTPEIFLNPSRPKAGFMADDNEARRIAEQTFELMMKEKMPNNISISILPFDEFKLLHSRFGAWNNGILGFSLNGSSKNIFVRENDLDALMLVIGHEIGHVLTETLANSHDEEAKAFAFSIEWAKTIKEHDIANLGLNIKEAPDFQPARNGLHDVAFGFVDFMVKKGRKAMHLHDDLVKRYTSIFNSFYS